MVFIFIYFKTDIANHKFDASIFSNFILSLHDQHHNQLINYYTKFCHFKYYQVIFLNPLKIIIKFFDYFKHHNRFNSIKSQLGLTLQVYHNFYH